jgi:hypothetical protein
VGKSKKTRPSPGKLELRVRMLLRNGLVSKSGCTLADSEVLREIAVRLGYDTAVLEKIDVTDPTVNPYARIGTSRRIYEVTFESGCTWPTWAESEADALAQAADCVPSEKPVRAA